MFDWLRRRLKDWLEDDVPAVKSIDRKLQCTVRDRGATQVVWILVDGTCGLRLRGRELGTTSDTVRLVGVDQATDPGHFRDLWNLYSRGAKVTWEDGTPASP